MSSVHTENLFWSRQFGSDCKVCGDPPACSCPDDTECFQINRDCHTCSTFQCEPKAANTPTQTKGVSKGALAGAVVGIIIFLVVAVAFFFWYKRKQKDQKSKQSPVIEDAPAPAEDVLKRPDPSEKLQTQAPDSTVRVYSSQSNTTIDLNPESQDGSAVQTKRRSRASGHSNPFTDTQSIQTAGTEGTNVIPIALVPPEISAHSTHSEPSSPIRPPRSPDLNLDHANASLNTPDNQYAESQISGISGFSRRHSYQTNASFSSDFLYEAPMIVTGSSAVRQVLGVSKAEVIAAPGLSPGNDGLRVPNTRPAMPSPLAASSFGPADVLKEVDEGQELVLPGDPFDDKHSPLPSSHIAPPTTANTTATFGTSIAPSRPVTQQSIDLKEAEPALPWLRSDGSNRPSSVSTQAGSIVDIGNATRVNVGLADRVAQPANGNSPHTPFRTTIGRLVTPSATGFMEDQQQAAFVNAQFHEVGRRSSAASGVSLTADSILESFPFVPPSPISNRPARTPPVSPLGKQVFQAPPAEQPSSPLLPPNRKFIPSTGSHMSVESSGLGAFDFQVDPEPSEPPRTETPASTSSTKPPAPGKHRASLDTLALTSDLTSYPLGFDSEARESYNLLTKRG